MADPNVPVTMANVDVPTQAPTEIDTAAADFIKQMESEYRTEELSAIPDVDPTNVQAQPEGVPPVESATPPVEPPKEGDPAVERGLERLVAREVELRAREERTAAAEKQIEALVGRIRELESRLPPEDLVTSFADSPTKGFQALGLDPDLVIKRALAERIAASGKPVPEALSREIDKLQQDQRVRALENKLFEQQRAQAAQAFFNHVSVGAQTYVKTGISSDAPTLAEVAKTAPERVHAEIMEEITRDARQRAAREPNGEVLPYSEAAKRVEARWAEMRKLFGPSSQAPSTPNPANAGTPAPKTTAPGAQNSANPPPVTKAPTNATIKPPDKPIYPWQRQTDIEDEGLKAALAEWKRIESGR